FEAGVAVDERHDAGDHWQSTFRQQRSSGNARRAARIAADLAALYAGVFGNEALAAGWLARAHRLLAGTGRCVERGYVRLPFSQCIGSILVPWRTTRRSRRSR